MTLRLAVITAPEHLAFIKSQPSASFLQTPAWAQVKSDWRSESIGWFDGDELVGAGLVLYRPVPRLPMRTLAYLPEGPVIDWTGARLPQYGLVDWLGPMLAHLKSRGSFTVKMGPPVPVRRWGPATLKAAIDGGTASRLRDLAPDVEDPAVVSMIARLRELGWEQDDAEGAGFGDVQPRYVFQIPLAGRTEDQVFAAFNTMWRRNVRKAAKSGVTVTVGGYDDLAGFHDVYRITAERDHFLPRPLAYFQQMYKAMSAEDPDRIRVYLAHHQGRLLASTTMVTVGQHTWYSYGASANEGREVRPSNAVQWQMIKDAMAMGSAVYDMRGISDTMDPNDPLFGLIKFKSGTGGEAVELSGEWDFPLRGIWHKAFKAYMGRR